MKTLWPDAACCFCEDNYMNTEIAVMLLKEKGLQVETAENGQEGLKNLPRLLSVIMMPS
jgi:CheY-like chemotaxis protein